MASEKRPADAAQSSARPTKQARLEGSPVADEVVARKTSPNSAVPVIGNLDIRIIAGIRHYAEPGEDLDWTVVKDKQIRQKMQRTIGLRKRKEAHRHKKGLLGSGGNYLGAEGVRAFMANLDNAHNETMQTRTRDAHVIQKGHDSLMGGHSEEPTSISCDKECRAGDTESDLGPLLTSSTGAAMQQMAFDTTTDGCDMRNVDEHHGEDSADFVIEASQGIEVTSHSTIPDGRMVNLGNHHCKLSVERQGEGANDLDNTHVASDFDVQISRGHKLLKLSIPALRGGAQKKAIDASSRDYLITATSGSTRPEAATFTQRAIDIRHIESQDVDTTQQCKEGDRELVVDGEGDSDSESIRHLKLEDIHLRREEIRLRLADHRSKADRAPVHDVAEDCAFVELLKPLLETQSHSKSETWMKWTCGRVLGLLEGAQPPGQNEALFLSGKAAMKQMASGQRFDGPIFTEGQQPSGLHSLEEFLAEHYDDDAETFVQMSSVNMKNNSWCQAKKMSDVKAHFCEPAGSYPWNLLELANHIEDGVRPKFLNHEDCRLLTKIKFPGKTTTARHGYSPGWKEVEKWVLVAEAGAVTGPHQDSHGFNTYITVQQGFIGFGWLANPTPEERAAWVANTDTFTGGRWRYVILKPGQTVAFPSGVVHFVFRSPTGGNTLAFGGHYLRCSQIVRWVETLLEEQANTNVTNEDLTVSAPEYLKKVERFVRGAAQQGKEYLWGGSDSIMKFLELKERFFVKNSDRHARARARKA